MKKEYNNKHDATLLKSVFISGKHNHQNGEIVAHNQKIEQVTINVPVSIGRENYFKQHYLSRDFIVDLYNQIIEIEKITVDIEYDNLPF